MFVIEQPLPAAPAADSAANVLVEWNAIYYAYNEVACLILGSMTPELHRQFENSSPYDMIKELKSMFEKQAGVERFYLIQTFHACKQEEDKPLAAYVLQMKGYVDQLERLGYMLPHDLIVGLILNGLTKDFVGFVRNYNMHNIKKTIGELHAMLIKYEKGLPKKPETTQVMMIKGGKIQKSKKKLLKAKGNDKANCKGNDKQVYIPKPKNPKPSAKEHPAKDDTCHHYKEVGHWKRNCPVYLAKLLKKKKQVGSGFREARKLKQRALYLYVGNGVRAQVEAIRSFNLVLPNGLVICLDNFHYAPSITRGVVSVYRLIEKGFVQCFTNFGISVSKNNVFYFNAIPDNGIYEIDMHDLVLNVNCIYNVSTKSAKHKLDSTYLWNCRLAHIKSATCILNMVPTKKVDKTPYELWYGKSFKLALLKGYPKETMGYYFYFPPERKIVVARYVEFFEKNLITQEVSGRAVDLKEIQDEDTSPSEITSEIPMEVEEVEEHSLGDLNEPSSYKATMLDSESNKWIDAMNAKIQSMIDNMVWVLFDLPPNCKTVQKQQRRVSSRMKFEHLAEHISDMKTEADQGGNSFSGSNDAETSALND
nr:hypothetical protein [Tanacetum cinerariifolium]